MLFKEHVTKKSRGKLTLMGIEKPMNIRANHKGGGK